MVKQYLSIILQILILRRTSIVTEAISKLAESRVIFSLSLLVLDCPVIKLVLNQLFLPLDFHCDSCI
jgi:hypothetical protein